MVAAAELGGEVIALPIGGQPFQCLPRVYHMLAWSDAKCVNMTTWQVRSLDVGMSTLSCLACCVHGAFRSPAVQLQCSCSAAAVHLQCSYTGSPPVVQLQCSPLHVPEQTWGGGWRWGSSLCHTLQAGICISICFMLCVTPSGHYLWCTWTAGLLAACSCITLHLCLNVPSVFLCETPVIHLKCTCNTAC